MTDTTTTTSSSNKKDNEDGNISPSFTNTLSEKDYKALEWELKSFVAQHAIHHRPIVLVSSGGTAADLEVRSVRCLDNFSTGLRGAVSVEEFLRRGYAVIHLWRTGSASPFGRVVSRSMGVPQANFGITMASLGKLFTTTGESEEDMEDDLVQSIVAGTAANDGDGKRTHPIGDGKTNQDPWLSNPPSGDAGRTATSTSSSKQQYRDKNSHGHDVQLNRRIVHSEAIRKALQERQTALMEGRLLTVPFRSVEEYLSKLQLSAETLRDCQSLVLFYLAAAVSDFFVPLSERSTHKIQSRGTADANRMNNNQPLTLQLWPVPKVMGLLRHQWAPDAFVCSFKLETDQDILRQKAEGAVRKYGCHMVIGNILETRHDEVWILAPPPETSLLLTEGNADDVAVVVPPVGEWPMTVVQKPAHAELDALEALIVDTVVQSHFEFISEHYHGSFDKGRADIVKREHQEFKKRQEKVAKAAVWDKIKSLALELAGAALGAALSYAVSSMLRRRRRM